MNEATKLIQQITEGMQDYSRRNVLQVYIL